MDLIQGVYEISEQFLSLPSSLPQHVVRDNDKITDLVNQMLTDGVVNFYSEEDQEVKEKVNPLYVVLRELVASSINYCYWYGSAHVRPNGANSGMMYDLVDEALGSFKDEPSQADLGPMRRDDYYDGMFKGSINHLISLLAFYRFPLLEERKRHLLELSEKGKGLSFARFVIHNSDRNGEQLLEELVKSFTGFASDIFLKRASLFFIQLYRQLGWFYDMVKVLHVPADYQVPNVLNHFGAFTYGNALSYKIQEGKLIESSSLMECQLRAATVMVCKTICMGTGWNIADVDTYLWTKRKLPKKKFHLTKTSDY
jgi:hypothetical protein